LALRAPPLLAFKRLDSTSGFDFTQVTHNTRLRVIHILDCVLEFVLLADVALHFEFLGYFDEKLMALVSTQAWSDPLEVHDDVDVIGRNRQYLVGKCCWLIAHCPPGVSGSGCWSAGAHQLPSCS
jgi:hypothetical protein